MARGLFHDLYARDDQVLPDYFERRVSEDTNDLLCKDFSDEEIGDALFQIGPHKAPGRDGFLAPFFQRNWRTIKVDVIQAVKCFFRDGVMPEEVNDTNVVVIPKVPHPKTLTYFRPISSCWWDKSLYRWSLWSSARWSCCPN
jgi:hypothetical protein